jgi:hypothetical protein
MEKCICIDDSSTMFKVIRGAHYWNPVIEKSVKLGDVIYFEKTNTGVHLSLCDNKDASFIFFSIEEFETHFEDLSQRRDNKINQMLN